VFANSNDWLDLALGTFLLLSLLLHVCKSGRSAMKTSRAEIWSQEFARDF
jgi:hypothetical protein